MEQTETMDNIVEFDVLIGEEPETGVELELVDNDLAVLAAELVAVMSNWMLR